MRYDGSNARAKSAILDRWSEEGRLVPICPEIAGGFPVPRPPAEIEGNGGLAVLRAEARVVEESGREATSYFVAGAHEALQIALDQGVQLAILTDGSPSCGSTFIYDGSFTGTKRVGLGVTAALLEQHGIRVFSEHQIEIAAEYLSQVEGDS